ncbi:MAG: HD domain-containing protein [Deltaproteobacteria bacterium]|nr:HD domain-containing protein [Deltaproteobacteria bacterium]
MAERQSIPERLGHDFLRALYHMIHTARIYQDNNQLIRKSVRSFQAVLAEITLEGDIRLLLWRSRFHLGGEKLLYRRDMAGVVSSMIEYFSKREIGSINFLESSRDALTDDVLLFTHLFNDAARHEAPYLWLMQNLEEKGCFWVKISRRLDDNASEEQGSIEEKQYEKARSIYFHAVETVKEVADKASRSMVGVRRSRRLAQNIVDLVREDTALMIGLTTIKDYDDYTYTHSVNVALLATCLGRHIGLSDLSLEHLSVCGLFHDLGKVGVPKEILRKQGALTNGEWEQMKAHPLLGVQKILMLNAPPSLRSRIILGPFEHHLNPDMTGYPRTQFMVELSLLGKILRIADVYEALTAERAYRVNAFTPDAALRKMWSEAGISFDPILLKCFINMMGIYPIGSVVELTDGSMGLVMDYPEESERSQPLILRMMDDGKGALMRGDLLYLPDQEGREGLDQLRIVRGLSPAELHINPAKFFLHME